jgi:ribosome-associated protein
MRKITASLLLNELVFTTSRSGGPGGQNVNKVNSKVTLQFDVQGSQILTAEEKLTLMQKLSSRITREGFLIVNAQETRSQLQNREAVIEKFDHLIAKAFEKKKARKATKPSKSAKQERIKKKKVVSEKKKWRRKPEV